jgi:hypothetical protein
MNVLRNQNNYLYLHHDFLQNRIDMIKTQPKPLSFARRKPTTPSEESTHPTPMPEEKSTESTHSEPTEPAKETMRPIKAVESQTGSITLASARVEESDPMKAELMRKGYILVAENDYGCVVRQAKGKPTFMARTKEGYKEADKRNTLILPDSIDRAMKMRVAATGSSVMQYLTQLVMRDLKENGIEI